MKSAFSTVLTILLYSLVGSQLTVLNKYVLKLWGAPNFVVFCQLCFTAVVAVVRSTYADIDGSHLGKFCHLPLLRAFLPLVVFFFIVLLSSMQLLREV